VRRWTNRITSAAKRQWSDPLSRGGLALLANTGLTGILGFGYWIVAARLFSTFAVGVAGALVAATTLLSGVGQLNLSGMLMRFLPSAADKSRRLVLGTYACAAGAAALLALAAMAGIRLFASPASPLRLSGVQSAALVLAAAAMAIFTIEDNVLVGLRRAVWVPVENGTFGAAKIAAILVLAPAGTAFALFGAWMIPLVLTIPAISAVLFLRFLPAAPKPRSAARLGPQMRSQIIRFAAGDAAGGIFTQTWTYFLPVLIIAELGASANALFYTSFLFSSTIDQVAANYASPLTVEGAHAPDKIAILIRRALRHIFVIIVPVVVTLAVICPWLLRAFGEKYVRAAPLLVVLLIACLPKAVSTVYYSYCRVQHSTHRSAIMQGCVCIATLTAAALFAHRSGLLVVGVVIIGVQSAAGIVSWLALRRGLSRLGDHGKQGRHRRQPDSTGPAGVAKLSVTGR
jgi:O-antigen/teichoic acid export membrane protein